MLFLTKKAEMRSIFCVGAWGRGGMGGSFSPRLSVSLSPCLLITLAILFLVAALAAPEARAQQRPDTTRQALPDIAPREVEIRGQLEISLPALERQPLTGFTDPALVPPLPPHRPALDPYERAQTPPQALPGQARAGDVLRYPPPAKGLFEVGAGRYFSRFGLAHVTLPLSAHETLALRLDYRGSSGHTPFEGRPSLDASFDALDGRLRIGTQQEAFSLGLALDGFLRTYTLYGARSNTSSVHAQPERRGRGGRGTLRFSLAGPVPVALAATYGETYYVTDLFEEGEGTDPERRAQRLAVRADARAEIGGRPATVGAALTVTGLDTGGSLRSDLTTFDGGATYQLLATPTYDLTVGGRALIVHTRRPEATGAMGTSIYPSPVVRFNWHPRPNVTVYAENQPGLEAHRLADLFQEAPFLVPEPLLAPTVRFLDAEAGVQLFAGPVELRAQAGLRQMPHFLYFEAADQERYTRGFTAAHYGEARVLHAGASFSVRPLPALQASISASVRNGRLTGTGDDTIIPYFAPVVGQALLSYRFLDGRGLFQFTGTFEGMRYVDQQKSVQLDPFFNLDLQLAYDITSSLGAVLRVQNIGGGMTRWRYYPQAPLVVMTGLRVRW